MSSAMDQEAEVELKSSQKLQVFPNGILVHADQRTDASPTRIVLSVSEVLAGTALRLCAIIDGSPGNDDGFFFIVSPRQERHIIKTLGRQLRCPLLTNTPRPC